MTTVSYDPEQFRIEIKGHAGMAPAGRDLACASVSTLVFTLMNAASAVEEYRTHIMTCKKDACIRVECDPDQEHEQLCSEMFRTIMFGFEALQELHPEYIHLTGGYDG